MTLTPPPGQQTLPRGNVMIIVGLYAEVQTGSGGLGPASLAGPAEACAGATVLEIRQATVPAGS